MEKRGRKQGMEEDEEVFIPFSGYASAVMSSYSLDLCAGDGAPLPMHWQSAAQMAHLGRSA